METRRTTRFYDHRLVLLVQQTRDLSIARRAGVPRSTAAGWLRQAPRRVKQATDDREFLVLVQTPDEVYFGTGAAVPDELARARAAARSARMEANRARRCATCA